MSSRYNNSVPFINNNELYEDVFEDRDVNFIEQYRTGLLSHPTIEQRARIQTIQYVWKLGDNYAKLAQKHYGDSKLWWVLAWYNKKPTDALIKVGDTIRIPQPINKILEFFGV